MKGSSQKEVLVRATGPALAAFGVPGTLADPNLRIYDGSTPTSFNDDWGVNSLQITAAGVRVGAFPLVNTASKDTAILTTLSGTRTIHINSSREGESGVVLVEAYDAGTGSETRLAAASARNYTGAGADVLVLGFSVEGPGTRQVLVRGVGPGLTVFGVPGVLADPTLQLHKLSGGNATLLDTNDDWGGSSLLSTSFSNAGAFALNPSSKDCAIVATLPAGSYTITVAGKDGGTGDALVELYELD